jgi:hypothetical protein
MINGMGRPGIGIKAASLQQYVLANALPWGGGQVSLFNGASPAVANGDMAATVTLTQPDLFTYTLSSTGVPTVYSGGSTARQNVQIDVYDMTFRTWMGTVTDYVNDSAPIILDLNPYTIFYVTNVEIIPVDLNAITFDAEGDPVTISTVSTLPPGLTLGAGIVTGTPTTPGTYPVTFTATDTIGLATNFPLYTFVVQANQLSHLERGQHGWMRGTYLGR